MRRFYFRRLISRSTRCLSRYIENPKSLAPKGKMAFAGVKKEDDRKNVIAYLAQLDAQGAG